MRSLQRNWRTIHYKTQVGSESILDEYGNETLEKKTLYSEQKKINVNVSANVGQDDLNVFGNLTEYSRTISYCGANCPLSEGTIVWFGTDETGPHNYIVVKVADSKNGYLIALREVSKRG